MHADQRQEQASWCHQPINMELPSKPLSNFFYYSSFQEKNIINLNFDCSSSEEKRRNSNIKTFCSSARLGFEGARSFCSWNQDLRARWGASWFVGKNRFEVCVYTISQWNLFLINIGKHWRSMCLMWSSCPTYHGFFSRSEPVSLFY
jgi:hypothetical protein